METKEIMKIVKEKVTETVRMMMEHKEGEMQWVGTKTDLLEMIHIAWMQAEIYEPDGNQARFSYLVREIFGRLQIEVPRNPSVHVSRSMQKKGVFARSIEDRWQTIVRNNTSNSLKALDKCLHNVLIING